MELINTFTVNLPVAETWKVLLDLKRVARCIPGAAIVKVEDDQYHGAVKIKVGPVTTQYQGIASYLDTDATAYRAVIKAAGSDTGGQGNVDARITVALTEQGASTKVVMTTELALSGRVAQFGRGVVADVANKILGQFVKNLEADMAAGSPTKAVSGTVSEDAPVSMDDVEPLDALGSMGGIIAKYALPAVGALVAVIGLIAALRPRKAGLPPASNHSALSLPGAVHLVVQILMPAELAGNNAAKPSVKDLSLEQL
ncbi:SRPBCC family protein [Paeniglutamicibacter sp. ZC-3]|uniref:SRPBCC family protein n=1 Tax=Paeniglutamicibacter sp. ZC-3 TaxID=2986919 RepID=UPI0021F6CD1B|nr:SRPBCC family protein [Paeniglutamicibacter sp. ZC-3]MCV9994304.1 SRPBCC family protein [Paeniglutamicibacter sp. ZC-3]